MTTTKTTLIHGTTSQEVVATLHVGLTAKDLALIERVWAPHRARIMAELRERLVPHERWPQSLHWDWGRKAPELGSLAVAGSGLFYEGEWQGVMMTKTQPYVTRHTADHGKPIVYVDYIEAAPWNWLLPELAPIRPRLRGCGTVLLREAVEQSFREEFRGRVGLHSLAQAERFYEVRCGMTRFGPDSRKQGLVYFEFTTDQAERFRNGGNS